MLTNIIRLLEPYVMRQTPMQNGQSGLILFIQIGGSNQFVGTGQSFRTVVDAVFQQIENVMCSFQACRLQCIVTMLTLRKWICAAI